MLVAKERLSERLSSGWWTSRADRQSTRTKKLRSWDQQDHRAVEPATLTRYTGACAGMHGHAHRGRTSFVVKRHVLVNACRNLALMWFRAPKILLGSNAVPHRHVHVYRYYFRRRGGLKRCFGWRKQANYAEHHTRTLLCSWRCIHKVTWDRD